MNLTLTSLKTTTCVYDKMVYNGTNLEHAKGLVAHKYIGFPDNWPAAKTACPLGWHLPSESVKEDFETGRRGDYETVRSEAFEY